MPGHSRLKDGVASTRLDPGIHVFGATKEVVDGRVKPDHDENENASLAKTYRSASASLAPSAAKPAAKLRRSHAITFGLEMTRSRTDAANRP